MTSMREKIARAIVTSDFDGDESVFDTLSKEQRQNFYRNADAVLEALMNPTEEMIEASPNDFGGPSYYDMIQAARDGK